MVAKPDEANSSVCDMQVGCEQLLNAMFYPFSPSFKRISVQMSDGTGLGDSGSVLDFMSMKNYPDMSLDISMLNSLGNNGRFFWC